MFVFLTGNNVGIAFATLLSFLVWCTLTGKMSSKSYNKSQRTQKIRFLRISFPSRCYNRLDQKRAWKLFNNWRWNLPTEFSRHTCFLSIFGRQSSDLAATTWQLVCFWKTWTWRNSMSHTRLALQKCLNDVCTKESHYSWSILEKWFFKHVHFAFQMAFFRNHLDVIWILFDFWWTKMMMIAFVITFGERM